MLLGIIDFSFAANTCVEVVVVDGPDHDAGELLVEGVARLDGDGSVVVVRDPLGVVVHVGRLRRIVPGLSPRRRRQFLADLVDRLLLFAQISVPEERKTKETKRNSWPV